jgi:tRNA(fMet)-specific endonuclease VapC
MTSYLLDTNHASALLKDRRVLDQRIRAASNDPELCVSVTSVAELWYMVFKSAKVTENSIELEKLLNDLHRRPFGELAAKEFGVIKTELRRIGRPIPDADNQIAAVARVDGLIVLTADAHFNNVANLKTENWLQ